MQTYFVVMVGGAIGTGLRFWMSNVITARFGEGFPTGTITVNVLGCFVIGLFAGVTGAQGAFPMSLLARQFVTIGILGGYTTFSSFSLQTLNLVLGGKWLLAALNVGLSLILCLIAVWAGASMAHSWNPR